VKSRGLVAGTETYRIRLTGNESERELTTWLHFNGFEIDTPLGGNSPTVPGTPESRTIPIGASGRYGVILRDSVGKATELILGVRAPNPKMRPQRGFRGATLPPAAVMVANRLVPKGGSIQFATELNGVGLLLINAPSEWDSHAAAMWRQEHRLANLVSFFKSYFKRSDLEDPDVIPSVGLGEWGWAEVPLKQWETSGPKQLIVGFPIDYESPSVTAYQKRIDRTDYLKQPPANRSDAFLTPRTGRLIGRLVGRGHTMLLVAFPKKQRVDDVLVWCKARHLGAMLPVGYPDANSQADLNHVLVPVYTDTWGWADMFLDRAGTSVERMVIGQPTAK